MKGRKYKDDASGEATQQTQNQFTSKIYSSSSQVYLRWSEHYTASVSMLGRNYTIIKSNSQQIGSIGWNEAALAAETTSSANLRATTAAPSVETISVDGQQDDEILSIVPAYKMKFRVPKYQTIGTECAILHQLKLGTNATRVMTQVRQTRTRP
jgi:hypothetical protein